jgi:hypothetical protein
VRIRNEPPSVYSSVGAGVRYLPVQLIMAENLWSTRQDETILFDIQSEQLNRPLVYQDCS